MTTRSPTAATDGPLTLTAAPHGTLTLSALLTRAGAAVRAGLPDSVWTLATVVAVKPARGGYTIELVDAEASAAAQLRAYLPEGVVAALRRSSGYSADPTYLVGLTVVVKLALELHPRWGASGRVAALAPGVESSLAARTVEVARGRLRAEGLLDRQRRLAIPRDVERLVVMHPPNAAGWADVAGELGRWAAAGVLTCRSMPVAFEGQNAAAGVAAAVTLAATPVDGRLPDLILIVRGGGARAGLAPLDDEGLARAIALARVPVVTGLGHASDKGLLADEVAWRPADTPSKALGVVRELIAQPARRARADHAAILAAVLAGVDRAGPVLDAAKRQVTTGAQARAVEASHRVAAAWATVRGEALTARERLGRQGDGLDRLAADAIGAAHPRLGQAAAELGSLMEAIRSRTRGTCARADDGAGHLAVIVARVSARLEAAEVEATSLRRRAHAAVQARAERAAADIGALAEAARERARDRCAGADDGVGLLASVAGAVMALHREHDAAAERLAATVEATVTHRLDLASTALDRAAATLDAADPAQVLRRGFALLLDRTGRPVTSAEAARAAGDLTIRFADGDVAVALITR